MSNVQFIAGGAEAAGVKLKERVLARGDRIIARGDLSLAHAVILRAPDWVAFRLVETLHGKSGAAEVRHGVSCRCSPSGSGAVIGTARAWTITAGLAIVS